MSAFRDSRVGLLVWQQKGPQSQGTRRRTPWNSGTQHKSARVQCYWSRIQNFQVGSANLDHKYIYMIWNVMKVEDVLKPGMEL